MKAWETIKLGLVATKVGSGATPRGGKSAYGASGIPLIRSMNVHFGRFLNEGLAFIDDRQAQALNNVVVRSDDVLLNITGASIGRVVRAPESMEGARVNQHVCIIRCVPAYSPGFLEYFLSSPDVQVAISAQESGVTRPALTKTQILNFDLPVPPRPEQDRIVEAIESYFTRLDDAVATLGRVQRNLKRYRASMLKAAVEGRLVPTEAELARAEGRDYEPASVLLERILSERRRLWEEAELAKMKAKGKPPKNDKWKAKYKEPVTTDADPSSLPEGWCWTTVDQLAYDVRYGTSAKTHSDLDSGVPVLRMGNIVDGALSYEKLKYLPNDHPEFPDLLLDRGDLLFNRTNSAELVGKTAVFLGHSGPCSLASYLIRVRLLTGVQPSFVAQFINSLAGRSWVASVVSQQVGQANVNGTKLKACAIPLPPEREQTRIVGETDRLLSLASQLIVGLTAGQIRCDRLRQAILKWAFEGKLVDQDAGDEPAAALLERIKAEREAAAHKKPKSRGRRKARSTKP